MKKQIQKLRNKRRRRVPKPRIEFGAIEIREARGKKIKSMILELDESYRDVFVEFEDGTAVSVNLHPAIQLRVQSMRIQEGDFVDIKDHHPILALGS